MKLGRGCHSDVQRGRRRPRRQRNRRRRNSAAPIRPAPFAVRNRFICCDPDASANCSFPQLSNSSSTVASTPCAPGSAPPPGAPVRSAPTFVSLFRANLCTIPDRPKVPAERPKQTPPSARHRRPSDARRSIHRRKVSPHSPRNWSRRRCQTNRSSQCVLIAHPLPGSRTPRP